MKLSADCSIDDEYWESVVRHVCQQVGLTPKHSRHLFNSRLPIYIAWDLPMPLSQSILPALLKQQNNTIPSPLLLLDEWLDLETSIVANRVEQSILNLTRHGAVILCVTHKPHLFSSKTTKRTITMCRGEILYEPTIQ